MSVATIVSIAVIKYFVLTFLAVLIMGLNILGYKNYKDFLDNISLNCK